MYWGPSIDRDLVLHARHVEPTRRLTGILTWLVVVSFLANPATSYEADYLLGILAFYLMLGHLFTWANGTAICSPFPRRRVLGPCDQMIFCSPPGCSRQGEPRLSNAANFMMRLLQIHFAIIIVTSALHKLQIADWWAGLPHCVSAARAVSGDRGKP